MVAKHEPSAAAKPHGRFPKSARVRKRREYLAIQNSGRRVSLPHFVLVLSARAQATEARLGITASRKVGCAVVRSRVRRLLREAFRATRELFPPDIDVVVIVKRAPEPLNLASVLGEIRKADGQLQRRIAEARRTLGARSQPCDS